MTPVLPLGPPAAAALPDAVPACEPDPLAVRDFQAALAAPPAQAPGPVAQGAPGGTLGDAILHGLRSVQGDYRRTVADVGRALEAAGTAPSMQEMLRMQLSLAQWSVQTELAGKVIGRSTQNIDQLVRMQ